MVTSSIPFRVFNLVGSPFCVSAADGQRLHDKIVSLLRRDLHITISFEGIDIIIPTFLNAAVGQLYGRFSKDDIERLVSFDGLMPDDLALLKRVIENAIHHYDNREGHDRIWREEMGDGDNE